MRFLADENFPGAAVKALARSGHDMAWVRVRAPGLSDADVLALADKEERVLLTFDKDFGERARSASLPPNCGVVLFRIPMPQARDADRLARMVESRVDWAGHFSVVEPGRIRMRPLPKAT
jgi:Domain of unknown function (DUF5615)